MPRGRIREVIRINDTIMAPQKKVKVSKLASVNGKKYNLRTRKSVNGKEYNLKTRNSVNGKEYNLKTRNSMNRKDNLRTSIKDSTPDGEWRPSNLDRHNHCALKNNLHCDVTFKVGTEEIKRSFHAHRFILAQASPVFEAMFYGQLAEKGDSVTITDIKPEGFEALLRYIYTYEVAVEDNIDFLFQLWYAADKYCIPHLKIGCEMHFVSAVLSPSNVWTALQAAIFFDIEMVVERCHTFLSSNTEDSLLSKDFTSINVETMKSFLSCDLLHMSEISLLSELIKWAKAQKECSLKKAVEPCIKLIRFGALTTLEFCQFLDMTEDLMSERDALSIFKYLTKPKSYPLPDWCTTKSWRSYYSKDDGDNTSSSVYTTDSSSCSSNRYSTRRHTDLPEDNHRLNEYKYLISKLLKERHAQSVPLKVLNEFLLKQSGPFTPEEITYALEALSEANEVMVANEIVFLI